MTVRGSVAVIGAGDFIGSAIARRFATEGFPVFAGRRDAEKLAPLVADIEAEGGVCHARAVDAREEAQVAAFLAEAEAGGPLAVCVFNIGANVRFPALETTERVFRKVWELACLGGFLTGREAARHMAPRGAGSIFFTGATASMRGGSGYAAFASAKAGLRAVAQSFARELGPQGVHVAHLVIDAAVDTRWVRERMGPEREAELRPDQLMRPESVADAYWHLHNQTPDAWTHEMDLRPFGGDVVMARTLDVYFDFGSMNSYCAHKVLPGVAERTGVQLRVVPVLIGGLFKLVGNLPPIVAFKDVKGKVEYFHTETARFVRRHGLDRYRWNPHFPVNTLAAMRAATAADMDGTLAPFADAGFRAMWEDERPLAEPETLRAVIAEAGLDPARIMARMQEQEVKDRLTANTSELAARGGFGLPSVFLGDELYYGKDSLRDLEDDLAEAA